MSGEGEGMSKSAKRRAAKKARDATGGGDEAEEAPAPPAPEPKAKAKAKAKAEAEPKAEPKAKAKAAAAPAAAEPKAKAKGKAKAKAEPEPPAPAPKAEPKAKGKAKAKSEPAAPPPPPAPKAEAKAKSQPGAKAKAKAAKPVVEEVEEVKPEKEELVNWTIDDGSGGAWEAASGVSKKQQRRQQRVEEEKAAARAAGIRPGAPIQHIPGMGPAAAGQAANTAGPTASQSINAAAEVQKILDMKSGVEMPAPGSVHSASVHVPEKKIGIVIGPKGSKIQLIQEKTGAKIDTSGEIFTITGPASAVSQAEQAVKELVDKGYCSMQYEDFSENFVNVHPSCFPDLIGKQGAVIRKIKEELDVEVSIPTVPPGAAPSKKFKVGLAGSTTNVEKAKNVINEIVMYGHSEITHPGVVHEEMEVDAWAYRYIIGTKGSEMKHIQHNWKVKVNIPREHSVNQKVTVVGEPDHVERAKTYIEKVLWNAENQTKGRDKVDATDEWGDEEEEEDWMKAYLYKR